MAKQAIIAICASLLVAGNCTASSHDQIEDDVSLLQVTSVTQKKSLLQVTNAHSSTSAISCLDTDEARVYKYTVPSSLSHVDAAWTAKLFLFTWEPDLNFTCERSVFQGRLHMNENTRFTMDLHYIYHPSTNGGPLGVSYWDKYFVSIHTKSFHTNTYNAFMDQSLTLYTRNLTAWLESSGVLANGHLIRKLRWGEDWQYSVIISSPSGKIVEVIGSELSEGFIGEQVKEWSAEECPSAHLTGYSHKELRAWYVMLESQSTDRSETPQFLPVRSSITVRDAAEVMSWYKTNFPAIGQSMRLQSTSACDVAFSDIGVWLDPDFKHRISFVSNANLPLMGGSHSVPDFVNYIERVNDEFTGVNEGWSLWYDRHLGINVYNCKLDRYMEQFASQKISFHPHVAIQGDHIWTGGTQGWGIELDGDIDFSFANCFSIFSWCTDDTDPPPGENELWTCVASAA